MPDFSSEKRQIAALKLRMAQERSLCRAQVHSLLPSKRTLASASTMAGVARRALPLLRPYAFSILHGIFSKRRGRKLLKVGGIAALAFGAWKLFGDSDED